MFGKFTRLPVFCDGNSIAKLGDSRTNTVAIPVGTHELTSISKKHGVRIDFQDGQEYFLKLELVNELIGGHIALTFVPIEQGRYESARMKTADEKTVRGKCGTVNP